MTSTMVGWKIINRTVLEQVQKEVAIEKEQILHNFNKDCIYLKFVCQSTFLGM